MVISISILISLFLVSQEIFTTFALFKRLWRPHFLCMYSCQQKEKQKVLSCDSGNLSPPINLLFSPVTPHYDPHTPRQTHTSDDRSESLSGEKKKSNKTPNPSYTVEVIGEEYSRRWAACASTGCTQSWGPQRWRSSSGWSVISSFSIHNYLDLKSDQLKYS